MKHAGLEALKLLEISEKNYEKSFLKARKNPEMVQKLMTSEQGIRLELEPKQEIRESKADIKRILMEKI